jgi:sugar phosphate isomerase/epimerase
MIKYALNTNCLRNDFSRKEIVSLAKKAGVSGIEWGLHGLETAAADAREMAQLTTDAGLEVLGFINAPALWKTDLMRRWSEAVAGCGAKTLRVSPPWYAWDYNEAMHQKESFIDQLKITREGLDKLQDLSREFHLRYVVEIHAGSIAASPFGIRYIMEGLDPKTVGAIWDPANMMIEGQVRPRGAAELMGEYLAYVHAKNVEWCRKETAAGEKPSWDIKRHTIDQGMVNYEEIAFALKCVKFSGWMSFEELCSGKDNVVDEVKRGITHLEKCFAAAQACPVEPFTTFNN